MERFLIAKVGQLWREALYKWTMQDSQKNALANGMTCGEFDGNGLLRKATVFYDLPAA